MKKILSLCLMALFAVSVYAKDFKSIVLKPTPGMRCQNCEKKIKSNIRFVKGTKTLETNLEKQEIYITYDAEKATIEDFVAAFKKIGYSVELIGEPKSVDARTGATTKK